VKAEAAAARVAGIAGFLAVSLGAFGAHGLKALLEANGTAAIWQTAVLYHLAHAVAALAASRAVPLVSWIWGAGMLIFSGSLYVLALTGLKWLGMVTPLGGLILLAGWALVIWRPVRYS